MLARIRHDRSGDVEHLLVALFDGMDALDFGGGDEYMHHIHATLDTAVHIRVNRPGQAAYVGIQVFCTNPAHRFEFGIGRCGESRFNDMDSDIAQLPGDIDLLIDRE